MVCERERVTKLCERWCVTKMVCERWCGKRWCVTKLCVKDGVWQRWCVTKWCVTKWCVTKWCVKDGVWQSVKDGVWQSCVKDGVWKTVCVKDGVWQSGGSKMVWEPAQCRKLLPKKKPASSAWLTLPSHEPISTDMGSTGSGPSFRPSAERRGARPHWAGASSWTHPSEITITTFKYTDF